MPDLGKYADIVLLSYGVSIVLIAALIGLSARRAARIRRQLDTLEEKARQDG